MERRTAIFFLADGKEYTFSERNREDINYTELQNKYRASRIRFIQQVHKNNEALMEALIFREWDRLYVNEEVWAYINDDLEEKARLVYASFKIANPAINFESFKKLVNDELISKLSKEISKLEQDDPALDSEVCKELKIENKKFIQWKAEHPEVYWAIKTALKKKVALKLAKKL